MTHRVETVMQAVASTVTGLTTTGANVFRGNPYNFEVSALPCLHVEMGPEKSVQEYAAGQRDWELQVKITGIVRAISSYEQTLNTIREEVHIALRADGTLGQAFIIDTDEGDPDDYVIDGQAEKPTVQQTWNWLIRYRRNIDNPGT